MSSFPFCLFVFVERTHCLLKSVHFCSYSSSRFHYSPFFVFSLSEQCLSYSHRQPEFQLYFFQLPNQQYNLQLFSLSVSSQPCKWSRYTTSRSYTPNRYALWRQSRLMQMKISAHFFWCSGKKAQKLVSNSNPKMLRRLNWTSDKVPLHCVASLHLCNCSDSLFNFVLVTHHPLFQITLILNNNIGLSLSEPLQLYQRQSRDDSSAG